MSEKNRKNWRNLISRLEIYLPQFFWFSVVIFLSLKTLFNPMEAEADAFSRSSSSFDKFNSGIWTKVFLNSIWLPGYFGIMGLVQLFFDQTSLTLRSATLFFHAIAVFPLWKISVWLGQRLNASWLYPWIVLAIFAFSPLRLVFATVTLAEPIFLTLILLSFATWLPSENQTQSQRFWAGVWSLFWLAIAQSLRFEAWYIVPFWWWAIWFEPLLKKSQKILLVSLSVTYPAIALFNQFKKSGAIFEFGNTQIMQANVGQPVPNHYYRLIPSIWWVMQPAIQAFSLSGMSLGIFGSISAWNQIWAKKPKKQTAYDWAIFWTLWLIPTGLILMLIFQVFAGLMAGIYFRYLLSSFVLGLPWIVWGGFKLSNWLKANWWPDFLPGILIIIGIILTEFLISFQQQNLLLNSHLVSQDYAEIKIMSQNLVRQLPMKPIANPGDQAKIAQFVPKVWLFGTRDSAFAYLTGLTYLMSQPYFSNFDPKLLAHHDWAIISKSTQPNNLLLNQVRIEFETTNFILVRKP